MDRQAEDEKKPVDVGPGFESGAFESLESDFQEVRRKLLRLRRRAQQAAWDAPPPPHHPLGPAPRRAGHHASAFRLGQLDQRLAEREYKSVGRLSPTQGFPSRA